MKDGIWTRPWRLWSMVTIDAEDARYSPVENLCLVSKCVSLSKGVEFDGAHIKEIILGQSISEITFGQFNGFHQSMAFNYGKWITRRLECFANVRSNQTVFSSFLCCTRQSCQFLRGINLLSFSRLDFQNFTRSIVDVHASAQEPREKFIKFVECSQQTSSFRALHKLAVLQILPATGVKSKQREIRLNDLPGHDASCGASS